jgi:hypothetical protein
MRAILLTISACISLACLYTLGWFALYTFSSKGWEFSNFTFAYFAAGLGAVFAIAFFVQIVLGVIDGVKYFFKK